jgi:hypothetical protein
MLLLEDKRTMHFKPSLVSSWSPLSLPHALRLSGHRAVADCGADHQAVLIPLLLRWMIRDDIDRMQFLIRKMMESQASKTKLYLTKKVFSFQEYDLLIVDLVFLCYLFGDLLMA